MKYCHGVILLLIVIISVEGLYLVQTRSRNHSEINDSVVSGVAVTDQAYWAARIDTLGAENAYELFKETFKNESPNTQHLMAHIFGGTLYQMLGRSGLSVCDSSFSFGCYHEFLGQAIHAESLRVAYDLNKECIDSLGSAALSCQHGIGHGIQTYLGYEPEDLLAAVNYCHNLPYNDPIGGCYGGIFMEYNMRTMLSLDNVPVRKRADDNLHDPCDALPDYALPACYYWQPQWWDAVIDGDTAEQRFEAMGVLCAGLEGEELQRECFEGVGNIAGESAGYVPSRTIVLCKKASDSDQHELYCRSDAANSYSVIPSEREKAVAVCDGLEGDYREYCLRYSNNTFNKLNQPSDIKMDGT